jgi:hypothetical protein
MKIYLSISKQADKSIVEEVKASLKKNIPNAEISFWDPNSKYDPSMLKEAELVIVIPPSHFHEIDDCPKIASVFLGKGNFSEFEKARISGMNTAIASSYKEGNILFMTEPFYKITITEENFQINWATIQGGLLHENKFFFTK